jgi:protein NrfD
MTELENFRSNPLVDPALSIWSWEVGVYLFLGGITAGVMILAALAAWPGRQSRAMRWMPLLAPVLLSAGMGALLLDLELKLQVFRFYTAFRPSSPMSWGAWILLLIYPATIALGLARLEALEIRAILGRWPRLERRVARVKEWVTVHEPSLARINVALGIALGAYTGILLGSLGARSLWSSMVLPALFLVSGVSTGAAAMMLFPLSDEERHRLTRWDLAAIVTEIALIGLFLVDLSTDGLPGELAAGLLLGGPYTAVFWGFVVLAGLLLPLLMETVELGGRARATVMTSVLLLVGGLALRLILVSAGQAT